ncbi:MAG TPA: NAD(P)-dependent oxidoreductase [Actinoplanes sp.]|nr:NAD(P)-dependent oxidoreductase [Actinoplanes sp.]
MGASTRSNSSTSASPQCPHRSASAHQAAARGASVVCLGRRPGPVGEHRPWDAAHQVPDLSGVDAVVHLAAAVGDPPPSAAAEAAYRAVNVDGTARLLSAAGDRPVVWVSSASVYRPGRTGTAVREDHPCDGQRTAYGRSKAAGERLALHAGAVVLRPRAVYGDGDPHLLPRLRRLLRGGRLLLPGPDVTLSLTAVQNLADACLAAVDWPPGPYNVADPVVYSRDATLSAQFGVPVRHVPLPVARAATVVAGLTRLAGHRPALTRYAVEQLSDGLVLDISRALAAGWAPRHTRAGAVRPQRG